MKIVRNYKLAFYLLINAFLFFFIILWLKRHIEIQILEKNIHNIDPYSIFITLFLSFLLLLIYGYRLSCILKIKFTTSFGIACLGHGLNNTLPFRLGEAFKIVLAKKIYSIPMANLFIATFIEKCLDLLLIFLIGFFLFFSKAINIKEILPDKSLILYLSLCCMVLFFCIIGKYYKNVVRYFKKIEIINEANIFVRTILDDKNKYIIVFLSILIWAITFFIFYVYVNLNLLDIKFNILDAIVLLFFTTVSLALPSAPASLGIFEAAMVYGLIRCHGVNENVAVGLAIVFHFLVTLPQIILMIIVLIVGKKAIFSNRNLLLS